MDDNFLYQIRPPVRKAFADGLHRQLASRYPDVPLQSKGTFLTVRFIESRLAWKFALVLLLVITASMFTFSGEVRAKVLEWIKDIAGFNVEERSESPLKALEEGQSPNLQPTTYAVPTLMLPEGLENSAFPVGLPSWVPEDYVLDEQIAIANSKEWVMLTWSDPSGSEITMLVEREYSGYSIPVGADSGEEIQINGQPALLIRGGWDSQHQWDPQRGMAIYWILDGHHYRLLYAEYDSFHNELRPITADTEAIMQQLIRMAESIQ